MYFELTIDILHDYGIRASEDLPFELNFITGSVISMQVDNPVVFTTNASADNDPPDFWGLGMPAMSGKFVKLLEEAGVDNLQKFPVIVKSDVDGTVWEDYFAVNILGLIKCADLGKSEYTEIFPGNYSFDELAIDTSVIKDTLLFRLQESPSTIVIHKSVGKHIVMSDPDELLTGWDVKDIIQ